MGTFRLRVAAGPVAAAALIALAATNAATPAAAQTASAPPVATAPNGVGSAFELTFWQSVTGSQDAASYEAYLARYPEGTFSGLARARIAAIQRAMAVQPAVAAPTPAPNPAPAQPQAPTPAVLTMPQAAAPLAPTPVVTAEAAPSPLARLLAQLRGSGDTATQPSPASAPLVTAAPPVQALPAPAPQAASPTAAPAALTPAATPVANYASARPLLLPVPDVPLPAYFCSTDARNLFHNNAYRPAVEVATRNNAAAVAYLRQLQQTYDRGQLGRDTAVLNAIAAEARAYQPEAAQAYSVQASLVRQFDALMAVPLRTCTMPAQ